MANMNGDQQEPNVPIVELYVRASMLDKQNMGPIPLDQQYFMAYSILDEQSYLILKEVITINPESPPVDFADLKVTMHQFPVLRVLSGRDPKRGNDISGDVYAADDDMEHFLGRFGCADLKPTSPEQNHAEQSFRDLYSRLQFFLKKETSDGSRLVNELSKVDEFLKDQETKFLLSERLTYADCILLPKLHHARVAAMAYRNFDVPRNLVHVWRYLSNAYANDIFTQSCPADEDIIQHYENKSVFKPSRNPRLSQQRNFMFDVTVPTEMQNGPADPDAP